MSRRSPVPLSPDCPAAPPMKASAQTRTLRHACMIIGGVVALATHLGVSEPALRSWMEGSEPPPEPIFIQALEVVLLHLTESRPKN